MKIGDLSARSPEYVRRIAPYVPGKPVEELAREYGLAEKDIVKPHPTKIPGPSLKLLSHADGWPAHAYTTATGLR